MPQIEFDGQGQPIPINALPAFGSGDAIPPTVLTFTDTGDLLVQQYRDLGFTHFEVWCIGAAGGKGGGVQTIDPTDPAYSNGVIPSVSYGGEGGGGGLQKVSGLLEDLPDSVHVIVGKEGASGADGNRHYRWMVASSMRPFTPGGQPMMLAVIRGDKDIPYMTDSAGNAIEPYFFEEQRIAFPPGYLPSAYLFYDNPHYVPPQDGSDGGSSAFHHPLGMASGGKGGLASPVYSNGRDATGRVGTAMLHSPGGEGGQGGAGGLWVPGGGGDGGKSTPLEFNDVPGTPNYRQEKPRILTGAKDGGWNGIVGQGGGGGRGGTSQSNPQDPRFSGTNPPTISPASSGGKGSFNYGDTSVYGVPGSVGTQAIIPGTAGGARVLKNLKYGSRTSGYSPNGIVVVRLTRIVDDPIGDPG